MLDFLRGFLEGAGNSLVGGPRVLVLFWPVMKDMLFMPFCLVLFLDRKPCFFACAFFVKTIRFSEVFFLPKILGREGGGKNFGMRSYSEVA